MEKFSKTLLLIQGAYFVVSGIWPVININSFMAVTGPKTDIWLVKTMGIIFLCEGICFIHGALKPGSHHSIRLLAFLNAAALIGIDSYFTATGVISPVYLADAVTELVFALCWVYAYAKIKVSLPR